MKFAQVELKLRSIASGSTLTLRGVPPPWTVFEITLGSRLPESYPRYSSLQVAGANRLVVLSISTIALIDFDSYIYLTFCH